MKQIRVKFGKVRVAEMIFLVKNDKIQQKSERFSLILGNARKAEKRESFLTKEKMQKMSLRERVRKEVKDSILSELFREGLPRNWMKKAKELESYPEGL